MNFEAAIFDLNGTLLNCILDTTGLKLKRLQRVSCLIGGMHLCRTEGNRYVGNVGLI